MMSLPSQHEKRLFLSLAALAVLLLSVAYLPGLPGHFIFDDTTALTTNPWLQFSLDEFDHWRTAANSFSHTRPISMFSFAVNLAVDGRFAPGSVKATNIALHLLCGALVFLLASYVSRGIRRGNAATRSDLLFAALASSIWLFHPLHVSTVLYSVQRMTQLSAIAVLAGLVLFARFRLRYSEELPKADAVIAISLWLILLTYIAFLAKENGVVLLLLIPVLEFFVFRGRWAGRDYRLLAHLGWVGLLSPFIVLGVIVFFPPEYILFGYEQRDFNLVERVLTEIRVIWRYLGWILLPKLSWMGFQHDYIEISRSLVAPISTTIALLSWVLLCVLAVCTRKRLPIFGLALFFFLLAHSIESSVIALELTYEHRNYLPSVGPALFVAAAIAAISKRVSLSLAILLCGSVAVSLLLLTAQRTYIWGDDLRFARDNVSNHPDSLRSNYFYGNALLRQFRERESLGLSDPEAWRYVNASRSYFERMYELDPHNVAANAMILYVDSLFSQDLEVRNHSFSRLVSSLSHPGQILSAAEKNALNFLVDCYGSHECSGSVEEFFDLLENIGISDVRMAAMRHRYLSATDPGGRGYTEQLLDMTSTLPDTTLSNSALSLHYAENQLIGDLYELSIRWMKSDAKYMQLPFYGQLYVSKKVD